MQNVHSCVHYHVFIYLFNLYYLLQYPVIIRPRNLQINISFTAPHISESLVYNILESSNDSLRSGSDDIPSFVLKDCACILGKPLPNLYNLSLNTSKFSSILNKPTFALFSRKVILRIFEIIGSSLSFFAKILEAAFYEHPYSSLKCYIASEQLGFVQMRSAITNLITHLLPS